MVLVEYLLMALRKGHREKSKWGGESSRISSFPFLLAPALGAMVDQMKFNVVRVRNGFGALRFEGFLRNLEGNGRKERK